MNSLGTLHYFSCVLCASSFSSSLSSFMRIWAKQMKCFLKSCESVSQVIRIKQLVTVGTQYLKLETKVQSGESESSSCGPWLISEVSVVFRTLGGLAPRDNRRKFWVEDHILSLRSVWSRGKAPPFGEFLPLCLMGTSLNLCFQVPAWRFDEAHIPWEELRRDLRKTESKLRSQSHWEKSTQSVLKLSEEELTQTNSQNHIGNKYYH